MTSLRKKGVSTKKSWSKSLKQRRCLNSKTNQSR